MAKTTTSNTPAVSTEIWKLAHQTLQKCANHPEEVEKVNILSSYLEDAKEILTQAFNAGEMDEETLNFMIQSEAEWVAMQWDTLLVKAEIRELVERIEMLEKLEQSGEEAGSNKEAIERS